MLQFPAFLVGLMRATIRLLPRAAGTSVLEALGNFWLLQKATHQSAWLAAATTNFATSDFAGMDPNRPVAAAGAQYGVREHVLLYLKETPSGLFAYAYRLGLNAHRIGLPVGL